MQTRSNAVAFAKQNNQKKKINNENRPRRKKKIIVKAEFQMTPFFSTNYDVCFPNKQMRCE